MSRYGIHLEKEYPCKDCGIPVLGKNSRRRCESCKALSKKAVMAKAKAKVKSNPEFPRIQYEYYKKWKSSSKGKDYYTSIEYKTKLKYAQLQKKYGLSAEAYVELLDKYNNTCALPRCSNTTDLVIDHDHTCCLGVDTCGKCIRGVLCRQCNAAIGKLGDSKESLLEVVAYLA